jgi:predicted nucleic acid-binding protein
LFGKIVVPPAVSLELARPPRPLAVVDVGAIPFMEIRAPMRKDRVETLLKELDPGEAEALALAEELRADAVLIDERTGRTIASRLGLTAIGTLGIVLRAKQKGLIPAVSPLLNRLQAELGFFLSEELRATILRRARER